MFIKSILMLGVTSQIDAAQVSVGVDMIAGENNNERAAERARRKAVIKQFAAWPLQSTTIEEGSPEWDAEKGMEILQLQAGEIGEVILPLEQRGTCHDYDGNTIRCRQTGPCPEHILTEEQKRAEPKCTLIDDTTETKYSMAYLRPDLARVLRPRHPAWNTSRGVWAGNQADLGIHSDDGKFAYYKLQMMRVRDSPTGDSKNWSSGYLKVNITGVAEYNQAESIKINELKDLLIKTYYKIGAERIEAILNEELLVNKAMKDHGTQTKKTKKTKAKIVPKVNRHKKH